MGTITKENPWKGLNFYREKDKNDFYGREEDIERLSLYIINNAQTVLFGKSGIGKSSILNAGVFPVAREHGLFPVPIKLIHNGSKSYLQQIKDKVAKVVERQGASTHELVSPINEQSETLWEYLHRTIIYDSDGRRVRLLLVIDQFEEIFTLQQEEKVKESFFSELADLLNDVTPLYIANAQNNRGDNVDGCVERQYVEKKDSEIEIDLNINEGKDEKKYLERSEFHIVLTLRDDFLGCLERYTANIPCMKTNRYALQPLNRAQAEKIITMPRENLIADGVADLIIQKVTDKTDNRLNGLSESSVDAAMLSLYLSRLYTKRNDDGEQITVELVQQFSDNIIKDFYEDAVKDVPVETIEKLEDELLTFDDRRNNVSVRDLVKMGIPESVIRTLVDDKKLLRQFNYGGDIRVEYMHDVLCKVVSDRIEQRELRKAKEKAEELKKKTRKMWIGFAAAVLFLALAAFVLWDGLYHDVEVHYGQLIKRYGWFEGLERISEDEASYRDCHYVLKYHGRWAKYPYAMEARDGYGKLTTKHSVVPYILNQYDDTDEGADETMKEKIKTICQWEFVCNQDGNFVVQERALDKEGNLIFIYNRSATSNPQKVISTYTDDYGFPLMLRDSAYFYMRTTYDNRGFETLMEFYDDQGLPITNRDSVYQTRRFYLDNGVESAEFSCFLDGRRTIDRFGNCGWIAEFSDDSLRTIESTFVDADLNYCRSTDDSVIVKRYKYDEHGRIIEESYWDEEGKPDTCSYGYHAQCLEYNRHGQVTRVYLLGCDSLPYIAKNGLKEIIHKYDKWGNEILLENVLEEGIDGYKYEYTEDGTLIKEESYIVPSDTVNGDTVYFKRYYKDIVNRIETNMYSEFCTRTTYDSLNNQTSYAYYDAKNNQPIEMNGYHINKTQYEYNGTETTYLDSYFDLNGKLAYEDGRSWAYAKVKVDSTAKTKSFLLYDKDGKCISGFKNESDDEKMEHKVAEESINEKWETIRTYKNKQFYYRARLIYPIKPSRSDKAVGWYAVNELGEPSVIYDAPIAYYANYFGHGEDLYFDEYGRKINPIEHSWFYLAYIELSQTESFIGFKDADIILGCNDWSMKFFEEEPMYAFYDANWWDETERTFVVARFNKDENHYDTIHVNVSASLNIEDYVEFKKCRCTLHEVRSMNSILNEFIRKQMVISTPVNKESVAFKTGIEGDIYILEFNGWNFIDNDIMELPDLLEKNKPKHKYVVYINCETDSIGVLNTDAEMLGLHMKDKPISPEYYKRIVKWYKEWKEKRAIK